MFGLTMCIVELARKGVHFYPKSTLRASFPLFHNGSFIVSQMSIFVSVSVFHSLNHCALWGVLEAYKSLPHCSSGCLHKWNHALCDLLGLFPRFTLLSQVLGLHPYLWQNKISHVDLPLVGGPLYHFCLLWIMLLWTLHVFLWIRAMVPLVHLPQSEIPRSHCRSMFSIWRNCQSAFCGSCIVKQQQQS